MTTSLQAQQQVGTLLFGAPSYNLPNGTVSVDVFWDLPIQNPIQAVNLRFSISGVAVCVDQSATSASVHTPTFDPANVSFSSNNEVRLLKNGSPTFSLPAGTSFKLMTLVFRPEPGVSGTAGLSLAYPSIVTVPPQTQIAAQNSSSFTLPSSGYLITGINIKAPTPQANCSGGFNGGITAVSMDLAGSAASCFPGTSPQSYLSPNGYYIFYDVVPGYSYSITPSKNNGCSCGLDEADIEAITSYILGNVQPNLQQVIAADFNASDTVTTYDIALLRKCMIGTYQPPLGWKSWRFVPISDYNANPPTTYTLVPPVASSITTPKITSSLYFQDFYGIKRGDVNQTCASCESFAPVLPTEDRTEITDGTFFVRDAPVRAGEEITIPVLLGKTDDVVLLNMELYFDDRYFELIEVQNGEFGGYMEYNTRNGQTGKAIHFLWLPIVRGGKNIPEEGTVAKLRLKAKKSAPSLKGLVWQNPATEERDAFYAAGEALARLDFKVLDRSESSRDKFFAYFSSANPATERAQLRLYLPSSSAVNVAIFDSNGRVAAQSGFQLPEGRHFLDLTGLPEAPGIYFVAVQTALGRETLRFVKL